MIILQFAWLSVWVWPYVCHAENRWGKLSFMCLIWTVFISHCRLHIIFCSHWFWTDKWIHPNSQTSAYCEYTWCIFFLKLGTLFHYSCYYISSNLWTKSSFKWLYILPNHPISKEKVWRPLSVWWNTTRDWDQKMFETTSELFGNVIENLQTSSVMIWSFSKIYTHQG